MEFGKKLENKRKIFLKKTLRGKIILIELEREKTLKRRRLFWSFQLVMMKKALTTKGTVYIGLTYYRRHGKAKAKAKFNFLT